MTRAPRGQALVLMSLTLLLCVLMVMMTLSINARIRQRLELQNVADAAAYSNAVASARALNSLSLINRTIVSHWVVMLALQANHAWGSSVPAQMEAMAEALRDELDKNKCSNNAKESQRRQELSTARDAFRHAAFSVWNGGGAGGDNIAIPGCSATNSCIKRLNPGFGQLDRQVADQAREVWTSIRDMVAIQEEISERLKVSMGGDPGTQPKLAEMIVLASLGKTSGSLDPYRLERGAPALSVFGIAERPPAWRELSNALGQDRNALEPMAHAVMGSRGEQFITSGSTNPGNRPTQPRSRLYRARIQRLLNSQFGPNTFKFTIKSGLLTTFLDQGGNRDDFGDLDADDLWEAMGEGDDGLTEDAAGESVVDPMPPAEAPPFYDVNKVKRVSPARSIGWQSASARVVGSVKFGYRSPCGVVGVAVPVITQTRVHTEGPFNTTQHEWMSARKSMTPVWDGASNTWPLVPDHVHGDVVGAAGAHGIEKNNHRPNAHRCHPQHRHWGEAADDDHTLGKERANLGVAPGGFGFVFPQSGPDPVTGLDRDGANGAYGQPKLPTLLTRGATGATKDPWDLTIRFSFRSGSATTLDLAKSNTADRMAALATGIAYYHRRCPKHQDPGRGNPNYKPNGTRTDCRSWNEAPNLLNPYWRATLVPIDIDEKRGKDRTPSTRSPNEGPRMMEASGLDEAAETYKLLVQRGYQGIQ